ncbi:hypothetical protein SNE40_003461 [Patella caerulea]|uniref:BHLH domain-containing protein n=1 Tax=Patella caerulea TaxID=87958 RepID=A0AAN8K7W6_PATCE
MVRAVTARLNQSASQIIAKKHLKLHLRRIREREYSKLRALVPSVASKKKVTKVEVVEEAVRYIEELHQALLDRFKKKTGNNSGITEDAMRSFVCQMMPLAFNQPAQPRKNYEKQQKRASYLSLRRPKDC